jgi:hypothetical protein
VREVTIGEVLRRFQPWLASNNVFVCHFEQLIGPSGGGDRQQQLAVLRSIAEYLEIPVSESRVWDILPIEHILQEVLHFARVRREAGKIILIQNMLRYSKR